MRLSVLGAAEAIALLAVSPAAVAAEPRDAELAELRAELRLLQAKVAELEARSGARSGAGADVAGQSGGSATAPPTVETRGGIKVTSADDRFGMQLGGRIHFDAYAFDRDLADVTGTTEFRRARLGVSGRAWGWEYKVEQDFAAGSTLEGLRDLYVVRAFGGGRVTIGQFKPYRSMEELTSSNEILMMERPFASASGLFNGRQFQQGVGYLRATDTYTAAFGVFNLRGAAGRRNEGVGAAGRVTFTPVAEEGSTLHLGGWASVEDLDKDSPDLVAAVAYAGRRGPSLPVATVTGASGDRMSAVGLEAAGSFGPVFFQGEYVDASFGRRPGADEDVRSWYLQGAWLLNGGHRPYRAATGVFGAPRVDDRGLWELTARYDTIRNRDVAGREASSWILGVNWYANPNLRLMFNYTRGDNEATGDGTGQYALRTQFTF